MAETTLKHVKCNLCGADDYKLVYPSTVGDSEPTVADYVSTAPVYGYYNDIVKCNHCSLIYMNPRDAATKDLYGEVVDEPYLETWDERARTFQRFLRILEETKPRGDLLDIGCYAGIFPHEASKKGYNVTAIEPSRWAADYARRNTAAKIITGSWDTAAIEKGSFDVVSLWDVIEHLDDPLGCLSFVRTSLRDGGIVAVTTHDIDSLFARILGRRYPWLMRFHFYHFSPETLSAMLTKAGLTPLFTKYFSKSFSLKYLLSRLGIETKSGVFERISVPVVTGDMFMVVARKD